MALPVLSDVAAGGSKVRPVPVSVHGARQLSRSARSRPIKFTNSAEDRFLPTLRRKVTTYFQETGQSRTGGRRILAKGLFYGVLAVALYVLTLSGRFGALGTLLSATACGLFVLLLVTNIAHDAAHDALSGNKKFDRFVHTMIFSLLGSNAYLWRLRHVKSHHNFPNVNGCDVDIDENPFIRLSPNHPGRWYQAYQHLYAPLVYALVALHSIFVQDLIYLFKKRLANLTDIRHPRHQYILFAATKSLYFGLMLGLPMVLLDFAWWQVLIGYLLVTAAQSLVFVFMLIGTRFTEETSFPVVNSEGYLPHSWADHALVTSMDWLPNSRLANFLAGGANAHAAHHLFPNVSHVHYVAITGIIRETASEFQKPYQEAGLMQMMVSHFCLLRRLGRQEIEQA
ncbi:fatty acid desaturase [Pelagibius sp. Alg239-R121]|uniref:fatty acid desaturase family protein n=1 Tax=Pelagibius sp. Alg239-R121 TaxID=2993448 RepID=UPI0024A6A973|nr:fatty acid desaturase [Pelagibius sp. Alg239-R121]